MFFLFLGIGKLHPNFQYPNYIQKFQNLNYIQKFEKKSRMCLLIIFFWYFKANYNAKGRGQLVSMISGALGSNLEPWFDFLVFGYWKTTSKIYFKSRMCFLIIFFWHFSADYNAKGWGQLVFMISWALESNLELRFDFSVFGYWKTTSKCQMVPKLHVF